MYTSFMNTFYKSVVLISWRSVWISALYASLKAMANHIMIFIDL